MTLYYEAFFRTFEPICHLLQQDYSRFAFIDHFKGVYSVHRSLLTDSGGEGVVMQLPEKVPPKGVKGSLENNF